VIAVTPAVVAMRREPDPASPEVTSGAVGSRRQKQKEPCFFVDLVASSIFPLRGRTREMSCSLAPVTA